MRPPLSHHLVALDATELFIPKIDKGSLYFRFMRRLGLLVILALFAQTLMSPSGASASTNSWKIKSKNFSTYTAGFASPNSVLPGDTVDLYITCPKGTFYVLAFRMGYYDGVEAQEYWSSSALPCVQQRAQKVNPRTYMSESNWISNTSIDTSTFPPGFYLLKIFASNGHESFIPLVVREADLTSRVVISIPTLTSLAYNSWKGASAYRGVKGFADRARVLSFDRPLNMGFGSGKYLSYVHPLLVEAEKSGVLPAYVTDVDVATNPGILSGAAAYVSGGHDEYWSAQERSAVIKARSKGTNLLFFGANVSYWRVRLSPSPLGENRRMEIYKSSAEDPNKEESTIRFRDASHPEADLTGQVYNCFPAQGVFTVTKPNSFIFKGTGAVEGSQYDRILGPEVDRVAPVSSKTGPREILASSSVICGVDKKSTSHFIYAVSSTGSGTISVGTMRWVTRGLTSSVPARTRSFVSKVTTNILLEAAQGPLGARHPLTQG